MSVVCSRMPLVCCRLLLLCSRIFLICSRTFCCQMLWIHGPVLDWILHVPTVIKVIRMCGLTLEYSSVRYGVFLVCKNSFVRCWVFLAFSRMFLGQLSKYSDISGVFTVATVQFRYRTSLPSHIFPIMSWFWEKKAKDKILTYRSLME